MGPAAHWDQGSNPAAEEAGVLTEEAGVLTEEARVLTGVLTEEAGVLTEEAGVLTEQAGLFKRRGQEEPRWPGCTSFLRMADSWS